MAEKMRRLNVPVTEDLNYEIEETAKKMGISKAGMVRVMINKYLDDQLIKEIVKEDNLLKELIKLADKDTK